MLTDIDVFFKLITINWRRERTVWIHAISSMERERDRWSHCFWLVSITNTRRQTESDLNYSLVQRSINRYDEKRMLMRCYLRYDECEWVRSVQCISFVESHRSSSTCTTDLCLNTFSHCCWQSPIIDIFELLFTAHWNFDTSAERSVDQIERSWCQKSFVRRWLTEIV